MSIRNISLATGEFFHVFNRGNSKQAIFKLPSDYSRFQFLLYLANNSDACHIQKILKSTEAPYEFSRSAQLVTVHAYCLMPNHYHLVLSSEIEDGITLFMQKLGTGYSMYFNKKYERTGSLFEGKFKAKHVDTDEYLKYLFSYIHMNPLSLKNEDLLQNSTLQSIKNNFEYLTKYKHSSFFDYVGIGRPEKSIVDTQMYKGYLPSHKNIYRELQDWLEYENIP